MNELREQPQGTLTTTVPQPASYGRCQRAPVVRQRQHVVQASARKGVNELGRGLRCAEVTGFFSRVSDESTWAAATAAGTAIAAVGSA